MGDFFSSKICHIQTNGAEVLVQFCLIGCVVGVEVLCSFIYLDFEALVNKVFLMLL